MKSCAPAGIAAIVAVDLEVLTKDPLTIELNLCRHVPRISGSIAGPVNFRPEVGADVLIAAAGISNTALGPRTMSFTTMSNAPSGMHAYIVLL